MKTKSIKRIISVVLTGIMSLGIIQTTVSPVSVEAAELKKTVAWIGAGKIREPEPGTAEKTWNGSYVWFGKYAGNPVKYRVLSPSTSKYTVSTLPTMLLDCDSILYNTQFNTGEIKPGASKETDWAYSDMRSGLNGNMFLDSFNNFTSVEKKSIVESSVSSHEITVEAPTQYFYSQYTALNKDKIFLLDFEDILNPEYGYSSDDGWNEALNDSHAVTNRMKKNGSNSSGWWLRSPNNNYNFHDKYEGIVGESGNVEAQDVGYALGVSPAFNINLKSILFTSLVSGAEAWYGAEYKLTLFDSNMKVALQSGEKIKSSVNSITVPYIISGANANKATQISAVVLDKEYVEGNAYDSKILHYQKLKSVGAFKEKGIGYFSLPTNLDKEKWGTDYHVYIVAEDVNGENETDYASELVELDRPEDYDRSGYTGSASWIYDESKSSLVIEGNGAMADYLSANGAPWYKFSDNIKDITIRNGVTYIGDYAFSYTKIKEIDIPNSVKSIGKGAFLWCIYLDSVSLGNSVKAIYDYAFCNNDTGSKLTKITIPSNVDKIYTKAIGYRYLYGKDTFEKIDDFTITGRCGSAAERYAKENDMTFVSNQHYLVHHPAVEATYTSEGNTEYYTCSCGKWFEDAWGNKEITEHSSVVIPMLKQDAKQEQTEKTDSKQGKDGSKKDSTQSKDSNSVTIEGVGTISSDGKTLKDTAGVTYLISDKITKDKLVKNAKIADKKSGGKYKITKITKKGGKVKGGSVTYMAPYNMNCKTLSATGKVKLAGIDFTVTALAPNCAKGCSKLSKVVIDKNVEQIGKNAFSGCKNLKTIKIKTTKLSMKKVGANAFKNINKSAKITVPKSKLKAYKKILKARGITGKKQKITK